MKILLALLTFAMLVVQGEFKERGTTPAPPLSPNMRAFDDVVTGANAFCVHLYQKVSATPGNLMVSPLSASVLLALIRHGAVGTTARQITSALHLSPDLKATAAGYKTLVRSLQSTGNATLQTVNKMYMQLNYQLKKTFRQTAVDSFHVGIQKVNFFQDVEGVRRNINSWVEERTNGKIQNLFEPGILTPLTRLVLVNAMYFKAAWLKSFEKERTTLQPFYVTPTHRVNVSTMHGLLRLNYREIPELNASAVKLPYDTEEKDMSMTILLPNAPDGLQQLEAGLRHLDINNLMHDAYLMDVHLSLPQFRIKSKHNLKEILEKLGITKVFSQTANLSNIADGNLYVADVVQKTFIGVDEEGTEAAVATGVNIEERFGFTSVDFSVDHPFLFVVTKGTSVLFLGRVTNPKTV